mmetsp:Transcript_76053/g.204071  ORF Transcript_76053/g.204071 Transcript_76053/m.204071 type:complete len:368 (-) Transcript_76053:61-1164(-)
MRPRAGAFAGRLELGAVDLQLARLRPLRRGLVRLLNPAGQRCRRPRPAPADLLRLRLRTRRRGGCVRGVVAQPPARVPALRQDAVGAGPGLLRRGLPHDLLGRRPHPPPPVARRAGAVRQRRAGPQREHEPARHRLLVPGAGPQQHGQARGEPPRGGHGVAGLRGPAQAARGHGQAARDPPVPNRGVWGGPSRRVGGRGHEHLRGIGNPGVEAGVDADAARGRRGAGAGPERRRHAGEHHAAEHQVAYLRQGYAVRRHHHYGARHHHHSGSQHHHPVPGARLHGRHRAERVDRRPRGGLGAGRVRAGRLHQGRRRGTQGAQAGRDGGRGVPPGQPVHPRSVRLRRHRARSVQLPPRPRQSHAVRREA